MVAKGMTGCPMGWLNRYTNSLIVDDCQPSDTSFFPSTRAEDGFWASNGVCFTTKSHFEVVAPLRQVGFHAGILWKVSRPAGAER